MKDFSTSVIRERIDFISDPQASAGAGNETKKTVILRSNRIALTFRDGEKEETLVVRAQTTPVALRVAQKILYSYNRSGLFSTRAEPYDWNTLWENIVTDYDKTYNPNLWTIIYLNGTPVMRTVENPHMDIIEKCAMLDVSNYDASIAKAEAAFKQLGREMKLEHIVSIASIFNNSHASNLLRCGIIQRAKGRNLTFSFAAEEGEGFRRVEQAMLVASGFLEAIELKLVISSLKGKVKDSDQRQQTLDARRLRAARERMNDIYKVVKSFENVFSVKYRPEKPRVFEDVI